MGETVTLQDHNSLKFSFLTLKLIQEKVDRDFYISIDKSRRLINGSLKYDQGKATSPPLSERAKEQTADKCAAYIGTGAKH